MLSKICSINGVSSLVFEDGKSDSIVFQDCRIKDVKLFLAVSVLESGSWDCYCDGKTVIIGDSFIEFR
jgi:hypothetical protein